MGEWRKGRRRQLDGGQAVSRGRVKLYVSHGAGSMPEDTDDLSFGESLGRALAPRGPHGCVRTGPTVVVAPPARSLVARPAVPDVALADR